LLVALLCSAFSTSVQTRLFDAGTISVVAFAVSCTEVNKLLTEINLLFVGVLIQLIKLGELPFTLLGFLLLLALFLLCTDLSSNTVTFLLKFTALFVAFFSLLLVLLIAL